VKKLLLVPLILYTLQFSGALDLNISENDIYIEQSIEGGYHIWIRRRGDIASVLLTESTADPRKKNAVYALRAPKYNRINGDEKRMLNGKFLDNKKGLYSIIDSTPEGYKKFGEAFHLFVPYIVIYGYPWSRNGELQVLDGTFLNIRAFSRPYGDYSGGFKDNPFVLRVIQEPIRDAEKGEYMKEAVDAFRSIAAEGKGEAVKSLGKEDMVDKIGDVLDSMKGKSLDLVLALDTTASMHDDMPPLKRRIVPLLKEHLSKFERYRVGLLFYKDYMDEYLYKTFPFTDNLTLIQRYINGIAVRGGRDIPEAVYEALYAGIHGYKWKADEREIILIGDAPPHPRPRGKVTKEMVFNDANKYDIRINTIILPGK